MRTGGAKKTGVKKTGRVVSVNKGKTAGAERKQKEKNLGHGTHVGKKGEEP